MPESGTYGSVRGVPGDGHPYRDHNQLRSADPEVWAQLLLQPVIELLRRPSPTASAVSQAPVPSPFSN